MFERNSRNANNTRNSNNSRETSNRPTALAIEISEYRGFYRKGPSNFPGSVMANFMQKTPPPPPPLQPSRAGRRSGLTNTLSFGLIRWSRNRESRNEDKSLEFMMFFSERMKQFSDWNNLPFNNFLRQIGT
jgi:hypothetical protein